MSDQRTELHSVIGRDAVSTLQSPWLPHDVPLAHPADEAQLAELLRYAARDSKRVLPIGCGSKLGWCAPPEHVDFALTTRAIAGVVAYEPGDGTLTARAGSTLAEIAEVARAGGNHLTPDVAHPEDATLGGVLASGQSGIDRTRFGPGRHHVLGVRAVLADGTSARSGGRLVKNVTGYDMHRLYCGSNGTLGVIVEVSLRLFPGAQCEAALRASTKNRADALRAARSIADGGVRAYSIVVENLRSTGSEWTVHVLLSGRRELVEWETETVRHALPGAIVETDATARSRFDELRDLHSPRDARPTLHIGVMPSQLEDALDVLESAASALGVKAPRTTEPTIATIDVAPAMRDGSAISHATWLELVRSLRRAKLDVRLRNLPAELARSLEPDSIVPGADWMRRLKRALDPSGVFATGGFPS